MTGRPRLTVGETGEIRHHKTPSGRWQAIANHRDTDGRTRQYARTGDTKTAAVAALKRFLGDPYRSRARINSATPLTTLAEEYFAKLGDRVGAGSCSPGTHRLYRGHWDNHAAPALAGLSIGEADVQVLDDFLTRLRRTHSANLVRTVRAVLSGMLGIAVRYKAIPANPVRDVTPITGGAPKPVRALEPSEAVDLLQKLTALSKMPGETVWARRRTYTPTRIHPDLPDLVLWMLGTSLRIGQAIAVHWPWIDLEEATAAVGPNVIRVTGQGLMLNRGTTKTKEQVLGLPTLVVSMLLTRRAATLNPLGPVFPGPEGGLRDPHNTLGDLRRALDMAGYEWVTSHTFRKTVATVFDNAGLSARQIADQLSHSRPSMTQDLYMARQARNPRAVAVLEAMLATTPAQRVVALNS